MIVTNVCTLYLPNGYGWYFFFPKKIKNIAADVVLAALLQYINAQERLSLGGM